MSKYVNNNGVSEMWTNTKNYISAQLLGKSDVGHTHTKSEITDFPTLSTVATSGSYSDLSNKPSIPVIDSALSSTSENGLQNKAIKSALDGKANSTHAHSASDITSGLATVATSGSYNDLSNKPTIPTVNNATLTIQKNGTTVKTFTANASSNVTANITVPTKTSDLTNDSHTAITMGTDSTSTASPAHGGTFTCIDSVTKDTNGHVTAVNTKTVTLPSDNNTDTKVTQAYSTGNNSYPVLLSNTAGVTSTKSRGATTAILNNGIYANPNKGSLYATKLYSGGTEVLTSHQDISGKSDVGHTHTMSDITDLEVWNYDSNSNSIIVSGGSDTWSYDSQSNSIIVS